jgi:hypothetical protein
MGQFVMAVPPVLLDLCEKYYGTICNFLQEMWLKWMSKGARVGVGTASRMPFKFAKRDLEMIEEHPKTSEME